MLPGLTARKLLYTISNISLIPHSSIPLYLSRHQIGTRYDNLCHTPRSAENGGSFGSLYCRAQREQFLMGRDEAVAWHRMQLQSHIVADRASCKWAEQSRPCNLSQGLDLIKFHW
jgi:hypothetical protein